MKNKSMTKALGISLLLLLNITWSHGQQTDSVSVFTIQDFFEHILAHHPVARQSELLDDKARQEIRMAKSSLDPNIYSKIYHKEFQGKNYFTLWDNELKIPTWYGVDLKAGYERNTGVNVSGENLTPSEGLSYAGISVPILQGLLIDERRSAIRQAQQLSAMAEAEKIKVINKLLLQAAKDYWDWMFQYNKYSLTRTGYDLTMRRYEAVTARVREGDLSAIDTVETLMQVQNYEVMLNQAQTEYRNSRLIVSNYLWKENEIPVELSENVIPSENGSDITPLSQEALSQLIEEAKSNHPDLIKLNAKLAQLHIERKYTANKLLPKIYLEYNVLQSGIPMNSDVISSNYLSNNFRFGGSISYPLFLRNERGKYQMTKLKIRETNYELLQTNREIINNIHMMGNEWKMLENQLQIQEKVVKNAVILRNGEQTRFENGESSVFLVNTRENYLITNQIKLQELKAKYAKSKIMLHWAAGKVDLK